MKSDLAICILASRGHEILQTELLKGFNSNVSSCLVVTEILPLLCRARLVAAHNLIGQHQR